MNAITETALQGMVEFWSEYGGDDPYSPEFAATEMAKHIKDQETRIQGLVEALEDIIKYADYTAPEGLIRRARQALTAYKEGK